MKAVVAIAGMMALGAGAPLAGAAMPFSAKPPAPALKLAGAVDLENKRPAPLLDFEIVAPAADASPEIVLGRLEKPLPAGGSASIPLSGGTRCVYQARWAFEDFRDAGDVDLCGAAHIVLVD